MNRQLTESEMVFLDRMEPYYGAQIVRGFKLLLETKHLYQKVNIETPDKSVIEGVFQELMMGVSTPLDIKIDFNNYDYKALSLDWKIRNPGMHRGGYVVPRENNLKNFLIFLPPDVKLFCRNCNRSEAFNFQYGYDLLEESTSIQNPTQVLINQVFALIYECQSCKQTPETFLIQRRNLRITLSGRAPIEMIDIPSFIPKNQKKFFSDAILAFNSGQILAANFLLRTFIEQYIRGLASNPETKNVDDLFEEYNGNLPDDFKQRFPSLKAIYETLSDDIHQAIASEDTFNKARNDINLHFEARKIFEL